MAQKKTLPGQIDNLRRSAEKQLQANAPEEGYSLTDAETQRLVHELQVHQIELEMQNEELLKARDEMAGLLEKYTDLYEFAPTAYFTIDHDGVVRAANLTAAGLLGIERSRLIGCRFTLFVAVENRQLFSDFLGKVFASRGKASCELVLTTESNPPLYVQVEAVALGAEQECRVAIIDITGRKRTEEAIRESEKRFHDIVTASADWVWEVDKDCSYVSVSGRVKDVLGYEPEEIIGRTPFDIMPPDEAERVRNEFQAIAHRQESFRDLANDNLHKNGGIRHILTSGVPIFDAQGLFRGYRGVDKDDTERKNVEKSLFDSEERHQLATTVAKEAIWEVDFASGTTRWNRAYSEIFGRPPDEHHHGKWWLHQIHPDDRERVNDKFSRAVSEGPDEWADNYRMMRADGSYAFLQDRAIFVRDKTGKALRAVGAKQDITELKQVETALIESEQRVRQKLDSILAPAGELDNLDLRDIIDVQAIQSLMDDFYQVSFFPVGIHNMKGETLVAAGWQEICTNFHRAHPESRRFCKESDVELSANIPPGEFRLYKCKNNMWDVATPLMVGGRQFGNIFSGQFFFEDDNVDYDLFRGQAERYGYDEEAYITALDRAPRITREAMNAGMAFFAHLSEMISKLSYSNIKLARILHERDTLSKSLRESEERLRFALENSHTGAWEMNLLDNTAFHTLEHARIFGYSEVLPNWTFKKFLEHVLPEEREMVDGNVRRAIESRNAWNFECHIRSTDGQIRWIMTAGKHLHNVAGDPIRAAGIVQDITARKQIEDEILQLNTELEKRVAGRTAALAQANEQLRLEILERLESEKALRVANDEWLNTFNASSDPIFLLDTDHHILRANKATAAQFGLPVEEIVGRLCHEIIHGSDAPVTLCPQCMLLDDYQSHTSEIFIEKLNRYLLVTVSPIFDTTATLLGSIHYAKDITSIKEAEQVLSHAKSDLERMVSERTAELAQTHEEMKRVSFELIWAEEKERERIAAELHDQVGQSLLLAKMKVDALEDRLSEGSLHSYAKDAASLIGTSIQDIRSLTFRMRPPILDTAGIATSLEWLCSSISNDYNLQMDFSDDGHPKPLSTEMRYSLYQAVRELLLNVVKHAGTETAQLSITTENQTLVVQVADNGVGFKHPDVIMKHINNGGYGLYNVRQRIEQMGGRFVIESIYGQGTTVTLSLPFS
jgi:PAS domain S-box-containing protein